MWYFFKQIIFSSMDYNANIIEDILIARSTSKNLYEITFVYALISNIMLAYSFRTSVYLAYNK